MGKIFKLPKEIVERISAGEVIERPVSIFKELVENSIDARATTITAKIYKGGKEKIIVEDNGEGISFEDLSNLFVRFSTSKIKNIDDIENIATFGFRGEALASIAAVSHISIISKPQGEKIGGMVKSIFSQASKPVPINCDYGTQIIVTNLFDNFPARKRFLKSIDIEFNHILNWFYAFALSYPAIEFHFFKDDQPYYILKGVNSISERIEALFGKEFVNKTELLNFSDSEYNITIYFNRNTPSNAVNFNYIFVNKRYIKNLQLSYILRQAFTGFLPINNRFSYIIFIETAPTNIDVNVHPAKTEIKFKNFSEISDLIIKNLREYLEKNTVAVNIDWSATPSEQLIKPSFVPQQQSFPESPKQPESFQQKVFIKEQPQLVVQLFNSYILIQHNDHIAIYDQHALSERILLTRLINRILNKEMALQNLSTPLIIELGAEIVDWLKSTVETWKNCGFDFEIISTTRIKINKLPVEFSALSVFDIQHSFERAYLSGQKELDKKELYYHLLKEFACKNAIKQGAILTREEMLQLVETAETEGLYTCIHGRPIKLMLSISTLDKFLGEHNV